MKELWSRMTAAWKVLFSEGAICIFIAEEYYGKKYNIHIIKADSAGIGGAAISMKRQLVEIIEAEGGIDRFESRHSGIGVKHIREFING